MVQAIDNSPTQLGYVNGVKCTQCGAYSSLTAMKEALGTIFVTGCFDNPHQIDGGELLPVMDTERLMGILDPREIGKDILRKRFEKYPSYFGLLPELLPLQLDHDGKPIIYVKDFGLSSLEKSRAIGPELGIDLFFLNDGALPTGSFKDRAVTAAANISYAAGYREMHVASTGNLVLSSLEIGSGAGMYVHALLPEALSTAKKAKIEELVGAIRARGGRVDVDYHPYTYDHINYVITNRLIESRNAEEGKAVAFSPNRDPRAWYGMGEWTAAVQLVAQLYYQHQAEEGKPINVYLSGGSGKLTCMVTEASKILQDLGILRSPDKSLVCTA